ncbi:GL11679 [Drosophila persimilis]|uniref:GL11679 n=1 Tax=Drosophila persimilis TaxID=7234 RepID=B4GCU7_DROPE|nr:GL11679 [Drosophila persimilis]
MGSQDKRLADELTTRLNKSITDVDTVMLNLDGKDFTVEPVCRRFALGAPHDKGPREELVYQMLYANLLHLYLKDYTDFFDQFQAMTGT